MDWLVLGGELLICLPFAMHLCCSVLARDGRLGGTKFLSNNIYGATG